MIIKVNSNFLDLSTTLDSLRDFNTLFYNNTLYISSMKEFNTNTNMQYVKSIVGDDCYIVEITEYNLSFEMPYVVHWCKEQFIKQDKIKYEKENQEKLQNIMIFLDKIEQEILTNK